MFDVLPPGGASEDDRADSGDTKRRGRARPLRASVASKGPQGRRISAGPRVVQVNWKLPARLRKPVRQQLAKERARRREREAIIRFERRPIRTRPFLVADTKTPRRDNRVRKPQRRFFNRGAEHHTGDTYKYSRPQLHVAAPPYAGTIIQRKPAKPRSPVRRQAALQYEAPAEAPTFTPRPLKIPPGSLRQPRQQPPVAAPTWYGERDVAFQWTAATPKHEPQQDLFVEPAVTKPKRSLLSPFSFGFLPKFLFGKSKKRVNQEVENRYASLERGDRESQGLSTDFSLPGKKKLQPAYTLTELVVLAAGCGMAALLVWNLQSMGRGFAVLSSVESRSRQALQELLSAQSALATTDFARSEQSFAKAEELLQAARTELNTALSASQYILRYADVTGTVRSGQELLTAGDQLTKAGQHITRALTPLLSAQAPIGESTDEASGTSLVEAIRIAQDEVGQASENLARVEESLNAIGSPFLPQELDEQVTVLRSSVPRLKEILSTIHRQSGSYLHLLGAERDRQYLLLFANNHELRPVGGFIGTIGLVNIDRGKVENIDVQSVYDPDGQLQEFIAPPDPLLPVVDRWYMRDANWFVDYEVSARKIADFFEKEGGPTVDGVILLTPDVIQRLLKITGPIEVPGYDITVSADNFIEVTQAEVTYFYDQETNRPKQFLADLTPLLLNKLFAAEQTGLPIDQTGVVAKLQVLSALATAVEHKELLLYFRDETAQEQLRGAGWHGGYPEEAQGFLSVNNANIGGHKTDQFIEQEIDYRSQVQGSGDVDVVLTIRREHKGPQEALDIDYPPGEDPALKDNIIYQRVLVPRGAQLLEATGFSDPADVPKTVIEGGDLPLTADADVALWQRSQSKHDSGTTIGQEANYTFFANWVITKPGQTSVMLYRYRIPGHAQVPTFLRPAEGYSAYIAKQPGQLRTTVRASLVLPGGLRFIHAVPEGGITREGDGSVVYRGSLAKDVLVGGVFERNR